MICSYAVVDGDKLKALQNLEKDLGQTLVAVSCHEMKPAQLTAGQLKSIKDLEEDLGVVVIAV